MGLNKKQSKQIIELKDSLSTEQLAEKFKVSKKEIEEVIKANVQIKEQTKPPIWFYLILVVIPFLFFIILEIGLRVFSYGDSYEQWVPATEKRLMLSNDVARRYFFTTKSVPYSIQNTFEIHKKENAFRVFVFGESSAAGYPFSPNGSFSRYIQKRLELLYPDNEIEVVNLAMTAINSYAVRDLFSGALEHKPDLVLIYTGHNEYYGALGVGSLESLGHSRFFVNLLLSFNEYRTTQLVRNVIVKMTSLLNGDNDAQESGTLMSRMAKEQLIQYNSDIYNLGIQQFEDNMRDVLQMAKEAGVPVVFGTLASNLKDQPPFNPEVLPTGESSASIYSNAQTALSNGENQRALSLFREAKERDALRFRAPEKINEIIIGFGKEFNIPIANIDSAFNANSPDGIVGNNLMVDHLHPTLDGYQLIGKVFYETMAKHNLLPKENKITVSPRQADSLALKHFYFSNLDSTISKYRIIILKNDWPFSTRKDNQTILKLFNSINTIDSLGLFVIDSRYSWEEAHRRAASFYLSQNNFELYLYEMKILIDQYPFITEYYNAVAEELLVRKRYDETFALLKKRYMIEPDAFSCKWLGIIELFRNNDKSAIRYMTESVLFNGSDAQVFFNMSGAYINLNDYTSALNAVEKCLRIDSQFPGAEQLRNQLIAAIRVGAK